MMTSYPLVGTFALLLLIDTGPWIASASAGAPHGAETAAARLATTAPLQAQEESDSTADAPGVDLVIPPDRLLWHLPSPESARETVLEDVGRWKGPGAVAQGEALLKEIDSIRRAQQVHLTLEETIRRTLANNYAIQTLSYDPAIATTSVVAEQARFDALLFGSVLNRKVDQPTAISLSSSGADFLTIEAGIRKLLPAGTRIEGKYQLRRTKQSFAFQTLNPAYTSAFSLAFEQPLLRGFGVEVNRSGILIAKNNRRISDIAFRDNVEAILQAVEQKYWALVQTRRNLVIRARQVADFEAIHEYVVARQDFDMSPVNLHTTEADLTAVRTSFVADRSAVFDAEDELIAIMNDPQISLADNIELIPDDSPHIEHIIVDPLAEAQAALNNRPDIAAKKLEVANTQIDVGVAENAEQPLVNLSFTVTAQGLGPNADRSFDEVTGGNFISYDVGVRVELPIGNRGPRANTRRAQLQHAQVVADLRTTLEEAIRKVNLAVRAVDTSYELLAPAYASLEARQREVNSHIARAERKDYATLTTELNAWRSLAATRRAILDVMVGYNLAISGLEREKGTLLDYNNVVISTPEN